MKARKVLIFSATMGQFLWDKLSLAESQINLISPHRQKSLEIDEISADKIWSKKDREIKVSHAN